MLEEIVSEIEKLDKAATKGPLIAMQGGSPLEPDDTTRWTVLVDGTVHYCVATIENGQPGDSLETEAATAQFFARSRVLLPLCGRLLKVFSSYASSNAYSPHVYANMMQEIQSILQEAQR